MIESSVKASIRFYPDDLGNSIQLKKRNVRKATGAVLKGRQVYKLMLDSFKTSDAQDNFFGVLDLATLQWRGDEVGQMEQFLQDWERLESGLTSNLKEKERIEVVLIQMQRSQNIHECSRFVIMLALFRFFRTAFDVFGPIGTYSSEFRHVRTCLDALRCWSGLR